MAGLIRKDIRSKIKKMSRRNLELLTYEIRDFLISSVSVTGGHLSSNLGVVELTVALHHVFDVDRDRVVWDVGHQVYAHKMLTGRAGMFNTLRQYGGVSGFPDTGEDPSDVYNSGHSSSSISAAMGLAEARDISGEDHHVVVVIGDGALSGGLAYEGLNNAGNRQTRMIVVLNDNETSIAENTGSVSQYLSKLRASRQYQSVKNVLREQISKIPRVGESMAQGADRMRNLMRFAVVPGELFEELGFNYYGPIDGHNLSDLIELLEAAKHLDGPVLIHIITKKGRGYLNAEKNPDRFNLIGPFDPETGSRNEKEGKSWSGAAGETMMELAEQDERLVCVCAAMTYNSGLDKFAESYYKHFFDVGLAEAHAVTFAAGLAAGGLRPFVFIRSAFLQRAYDQILHDVCQQGLPVVFMVDHAGLAGGDGKAHHGLFDLSFLTHIPGLAVLAPKDADELRQMVLWALAGDRPAAIRYPKGEAPLLPVAPKRAKYTAKALKFGKSEKLITGKDKTAEIFAVGNMVQTALDAAEILNKDGIKTGVVNARFASPVDEAAILEAAKQNRVIVTLEDNAVKGGFGEKAAAVLAANTELREKARLLNLGWPDEYIEHGDARDLLKVYKLDAEGLAESIKAFLDTDK